MTQTMIPRSEFDSAIYAGSMACANCGRNVYRRHNGRVEHSAAGFSTCGSLKPMPTSGGIIYTSYVK